MFVQNHARADLSITLRTDLFQQELQQSSKNVMLTFCLFKKSNQKETFKVTYHNKKNIGNVLYQIKMVMYDILTAK